VLAAGTLIERHPVTVAGPAPIDSAALLR